MSYFLDLITAPDVERILTERSFSKLIEQKLPFHKPCSKPIRFELISEKGIAYPGFTDPYRRQILLEGDIDEEDNINDKIYKKLKKRIADLSTADHEFNHWFNCLNRTSSPLLLLNRQFFYFDIALLVPLGRGGFDDPSYFFKGIVKPIMDSEYFIEMLALTEQHSNLRMGIKEEHNDLIRKILKELSFEMEKIEREKIKKEKCVVKCKYSHTLSLLLRHKLLQKFGWTTFQDLLATLFEKTVMFERKGRTGGILEIQPNGFLLAALDLKEDELTDMKTIEESIFRRIIPYTSHITSCPGHYSSNYRGIRKELAHNYFILDNIRLKEEHDIEFMTPIFLGKLSAILNSMVSIVIVASNRQEGNLKTYYDTQIPNITKEEIELAHEIFSMRKFFFDHLWGEVPSIICHGSDCLVLEYLRKKIEYKDLAEKWTSDILLPSPRSFYDHMKAFGEANEDKIDRIIDQLEHYSKSPEFQEELKQFMSKYEKLERENEGNTST